MGNAPPSPAQTASGYRVGDLVIDVARRRVTRGDAELQLSALSFDLLLELTRAAPELLTFEQLMERVWPRLVVGPEAVTQRVKLVRECLGDDANDPRYIAGVRGRGYRLVTTVEPFVPAASAAAPAQPAVAPPLPTAASPAPPPLPTPAPAPVRRRAPFLPVAAVLAGALVLSVLVIAKLWSSRTPAGGRDAAVVVEAPPGARPAAASVAVSDQSIAVLPFVDLSEQKNQEYFSDGIADEVIDLLARLPGLQVSARTSSFAFKGQRTSIADIAKALHVANVLEGSVRRAGDRVRVTAQLVRADNGYSRWSQSYDRKLDDILKVQDDIAGAVARALNVELRSDAITSRPFAVRADAYSLALEARYFLERNAPEDYVKAAALYQRALDVDPKYAPAWAGYSSATWKQGDLGTLPWETARTRARDAAEHAVRLDPQLPAGHLMMSEVLANDENWTAAAQELEAAAALDPGGATTLSRRAVWAGTIAGRPDDAIVLAEQSVLRDPLTPTAHYRLCWIYYEARRITEAMSACREALELSPSFVGAHFTLACLLILRDQPEAALAEIQQEPDEAFRLRGLAIVNHRLGRRAESDAALATLIERYAAKRMLFIASVYAARGEPDPAFEWLRRARAKRENQVYELKSDAMFGSLKADPRYKAFLQAMKLAG